MASAGRKSGSDPATAKKDFLRHMQRGLNINQALTAVDRNRSTYERWRREDPDFISAVERVKHLKMTSEPAEREHLSFEDFSEKYLDAKVFLT